MSDNITREPYRNAWYKQLADAVKKHDEEIAEMAPHLVPDVEEGDNGKILIAGEDGAFDWGQPPEELPVITESDEGKVLKVDEGVPKWLEDTDSEYLLVTITKTGNVYTADKAYNEIRPFAEKGKCVVLYNKIMYYIDTVDTNNIKFERQLNTSSVEFKVSGETSYRVLTRINNIIIIINSDNTISYSEQRNLPSFTLSVADGQTLTEDDYNTIKTYTTYTLPTYLLYNDKFLYASNYNSAKTEFDFVNYEEGIKAHIDANRLVTITEIPTEYLFVTITRSGTSPDFVYTCDKTYNEIRTYAELGKCIVNYSNTMFLLASVTTDTVMFKQAPSFNGFLISTNEYYAGGENETAFLIKSDSVTLRQRKYNTIYRVNISGLSVLSEDVYTAIQTCVGKNVALYLFYTHNTDIITLYFSKSNSAKTIFEFANTVEGIKATIDASRNITITTI